ncbi:hypothetical protein ACP70R_040076 [Stipagrostis hirtigluma subsp. patula]
MRSFVRSMEPPFHRSTSMAALSWVGSSSKTTHLPAVARPWCARRPPRPPPVRRSVAPWERDFCESRGVPWSKVTDPNAGLNAEGPGGRVARWDDSGAVEALLAARSRYWAEINGGIKPARGVPPLPGPDLYVDDVVDEDGGVEEDAEVEAEYEAAVRGMERAREESARLHAAKLRDDFVPVPTGWDM